MRSVLVGTAGAQQHFKQLAGPPAEFGAMAPADPKQSATRSKSALLPVTLEKDATSGQWTWQTDIPVEAERLRFAVISGTPDAALDRWTVTIRSQVTGQAQSAEAVGAQRAAQIAKEESAGVWIQDPDGNWNKK